MHSATTATTAAPASAAAIPVVPERADWLAVAAAGLSTFCVVTSEMLPVGLLAPIADELRMSTGMGGLLLFVLRWWPRCARRWRCYGRAG